MLLYQQGRRKAALAEWELAAESGEKSVALDRNLGLAYREVTRDPAKAVEALRRAAAQKPTHQRVYLELDEVLREMKADPRERLAELDAAPPEVHRRSLVATQQITACLELGDWDRAVTLLSTHTFHRWEAEFRMRGLYVSAYLGRGAEKLDGGDLKGARADFEAALLYPENLRIGKPAQTEDARARWCAGLACEMQGDLAAAKAQWEEAAAETYPRRSHTGALDVAIYRALCLRKLGKAQEADEALEQELKAARERIEAEPERATAHMMLGLALKAAGRPEEAEPALRRALELHPWMPRAKRLLEQETIL
jgi:tetratricopeptide (TPR) repeat protein